MIRFGINLGSNANTSDGKRIDYNVIIAPWHRFACPVPLSTGQFGREMRDPAVRGWRAKMRIRVWSGVLPASGGNFSFSKMATLMPTLFAGEVQDGRRSGSALSLNVRFTP